MPISSGLQKYFDSQQKKKSAQDMKKRFADLQGKIDPAFMHSFVGFHDKIMEIVEENPDALDIVSDEMEDLNQNVERTHRIHELKKAQAIIESSDKA